MSGMTPFTTGRWISRGFNIVRWGLSASFGSSVEMRSLSRNKLALAYRQKRLPTYAELSNVVPLSTR